MNNRFTFKDVLVLLLLMAIIVVVALAMFQNDRQWQKVLNVEKKLDAQAGELAKVQSQLRDLAAAVAKVGRISATQPAAVPETAPSQETAPPTTQATTHTASGAVTADLSVDPFARVRAVHSRPDYAPGDWLVDAFGNTIRKLTPLLSTDIYAYVVQANIQDSLLTRDIDTLQWVPQVAESWKITDQTQAWNQYVQKRKAVPLPPQEVEQETDCPPAGAAAARAAYIAKRLQEGRRDADISNEPDCPASLVIDFHLRRNVAFSDGEPLTAADVKFTYDFIMNPKIAAPRERSSMERIRSVEQTGTYDVRFNFGEPYFEALALAGGISIMPKHFYGKFKPEEFNSSVGFLLGSGPYRMEDPEAWRPGMLIRLVRNERYWGPPPSFDQIIYKEFTNEVAHVTAFRNGDVDDFPGPPYLGPPEQLVALLNDKTLVQHTQHYEFIAPSAGYRYIAWNERDNQGRATIFADKRVRQAMTMLLDRQQLLDIVMLGRAMLATGPFSPLSEQSNPEVKPWPYDVQRATALLSQAGLRFHPNDGVLYLPDNVTPFRFKLTYPSGRKDYERMVLFIRDAYARAGIIVDPDPLEWAVFTDRLENRDFEAISLGWTSGIETDIYQMFHSSQMADNGDDFMSYRNPELDALIVQARQTIDDKTRIALWRRCHTLLHEDQPYTFLFFSKSWCFLDNRIAGPQIMKLGLNGWDEWYVPRNKQRWTQ